MPFQDIPANRREEPWRKEARKSNPLFDLADKYKDAPWVLNKHEYQAQYDEHKDKAVQADKKRAFAPFERDKGEPVNKKQMDIDILDELIAKCEDAMVSPFKKKAVAVEIEPEKEEDTRDEEGDSGESSDKPDLSDMDLDELMAMYKEMKDRE